MTASLTALIATRRSSLRSRFDLQAEILALRHQLAVLQRQAPCRPRLRQVDRPQEIVEFKAKVLEANARKSLDKPWKPEGKSFVQSLPSLVSSAKAK